MSIKLIIFDFDGTLGDTRRNIVVTMQDVMRELNLPLQDEDVCASTIGLPLKGCYAQMFPQLDADELDRCAEVHHRCFAENLKKITPMPFPQVKETLEVTWPHGNGIPFLLHCWGAGYCSCQARCGTGVKDSRYTGIHG